MTKDRIRYRKGYKYQLADDYIVKTRVTGYKAKSEFFYLSPDGWLSINSGYAWDGPSGPAIDTLDFMRGSLVHDVLYQAIREGLLPQEMRELADQELRRICIEDGMLSVRAWWVYYSVRLAGGPAADKRYDREVIEAP